MSLFRLLSLSLLYIHFCCTFISQEFLLFLDFSSLFFVPFAEVSLLLAGYIFFLKERVHNYMLHCRRDATSHNATHSIDYRADLENYGLC